MTQRSLETWLRERIDAGDIAYIGQRDGIAIYRPLKPLYD